MSGSLNSSKGINGKENEVMRNNPNLIDCASPTTMSCVHLLVDLKNSKSKRNQRPFVLMENGVDDSLQDTRTVISSPLKVLAPIEGTTHFHFGTDSDKDRVVNASSSAAEIITTNSTTSLASTSSLSSYSSQKRTDSNEAIFPQSKSRCLPVHPDLPVNFTTFSSIVDKVTSTIPQQPSKKQGKLAYSEYTEKSSGSCCCNCKKSHCLKLYCECFKSRGYCNQECCCINCHNNHQHEEEREETIQIMLMKNPHCFDSHVDKKKGINKSGCRCKKTHCDKKYCECFNSGVPCGDQCQCKDCRNH